MTGRRAVLPAVCATRPAGRAVDATEQMVSGVRTASMRVRRDRTRLPIVVCSLLVLLALCPHPAAAITITESVRGLVCDAADVVVARPVDPLYTQDEAAKRVLPVAQARFEVERVLKGDDVQAGATIEVDLGKDYIPCWPDQPMGDLQPQAPKVERVVLYLKGPAKDGIHAPMPSGLHCITTDGTVLFPAPTFDPGPYYMMRLVEPNGEALLDQVTREAAAERHLQNLDRTPDPAQRNRALLDWITEHLDELGQHQFIHVDRVSARPESGLLYQLKTDGAAGWGSLNRLVFHWVMESKVPADCWQAMVLYSVAHPDFPDMDWESVGFCSPEGRALLLQKAQDTSLSPRMRRLALRRLGRASTLWYRPSYQAPLDAGSATESERFQLLDAVCALMNSPDKEVSAAAAGATYQLGVPHSGPTSR